MKTYSHLDFPGEFFCVVCDDSMVRRYTNAMTCGARCRMRLHRAGGDAAAARSAYIAANLKGKKRGRKSKPVSRRPAG